jgi:predicted hydrocarbon binding protein
VATETGHSLALTAEEIQCAAEGDHDHCLFQIQPAG